MPSPFDRGGICGGVRRLFRLALHKSDIAREDMDTEPGFHLDARAAQLVARGMSPKAARTEALRRLGSDFTEARAHLRHSAERRERTMAIREWLDDLLQDLRYAARGL